MVRWCCVALLAVGLSGCASPPWYPPSGPDWAHHYYYNAKNCNLRGPPIDCYGVPVVAHESGALILHAPACAQVTVHTWETKDGDPKTGVFDTQTYMLPHERTVVGTPAESGEISFCLQFPLYHEPTVTEIDEDNAERWGNVCHFEGSGATLQDGLCK